MTLSGRDRLIVQLVDRFGQVSSAQVQALHFHELKSQTPCDRVLRRLVDSKYLARIERRGVGGQGGGSGRFVYQLGPAGWKLHRDSRYLPWRSVNFHSLAIVDAFVALRQAEREGWLQIVGFSTEPDCWTTIGRAELKPDLYVELFIPSRGVRVSYWLEIDMGTERQPKIKEKLERYWHAYNNADASEWPVFPKTLFLAPDDERERELGWLIKRGPAEAQPLFGVLQLGTFPQSLV